VSRLADTHAGFRVAPFSTAQQGRATSRRAGVDTAWVAVEASRPALRPEGGFVEATDPVLCRSGSSDLLVGRA
jgi:hypothetical protein